MDRQFIAVTGVLVLLGIALAFAFVFTVGGENRRTEDIWLVRDTQSGSGTIPEIATENAVSPRPVVTVDFSNASKTTVKLTIIAHNQSAIMLSSGGKIEIMEITGDNPDTGTGTLRMVLGKIAEKIALADTRVRKIIGTSMYSAEVQPLDMFPVKDSGDDITNGTRASVTFTMVNSTTARDEATFFVHVDLAQENVIRVSPLFPENQIPAIT
jgi:hypothetical protein